MIKIAICENNLNELSLIEKLIDNFHNIKVDFDVFTDGNDLLTTIQREGDYDMYFLNILLPNITGLEIAKEIRKNNMYSLIVFLSAHSKYVFDTLDYIAFNYLIKPISQDKLENVLLNAEIYFQRNKNLFRYQFNKINYTIVCNKILYFFKSSRKAYIYTETDVKECNMTISKILDMLNPNIFVQINRSYIVNIHYIENVRQSSVLIARKQISIGDTHRKEFEEKYSKYLNNSK